MGSWVPATSARLLVTCQNGLVGESPNARFLEPIHTCRRIDCIDTELESNCLKKEELYIITSPQEASFGERGTIMQNIWRRLHDQNGTHVTVTVHVIAQGRVLGRACKASLHASAVLGPNCLLEPS